jgi:hypothetical protein
VVGRAVLGFLETNDDFLGSYGLLEIGRLENRERQSRHDRHVYEVDCGLRRSGNDICVFEEETARNVKLAKSSVPA